jgi:hypothetical protein
MDVSHPTSRFAFPRLRMVTQQELKLPAIKKCNRPRGAFGTAFRRLVCIPKCREERLCPLAGTCSYRIIFEPAGWRKVHGALGFCANQVGRVSRRAALSANLV